MDEMPIKCKDCIYWKSDEERAKQTAWLPCMEMKTDRNWFCGYAKKKEVQRNSKMNAIRIVMEDKCEANEIALKYTDLLDRTPKKQVTGVQLNSDGTWSAICTHTDYDPIWD